MSESRTPLLNPYTAGRPVYGDSFFGREKIFQAIREALVMSQQRLVVLHGQRRIGKTSILQQLRKELSTGNFVMVNFDLQFYAGRELPEVLFALTQAIAREFELEPPHRSDFEDKDFFENTFLEITEQYLAPGQRLLIVIDEYDIIRDTDKGPFPVASPEFSALLQRLINSEKRLSFLLVAGSNLGALSGHMQSVFRLGTAVRVSFFDEIEVYRLVTEPAKDNLTFSDQAIKGIYQLTSGHPYFTQLLCFEIFNRAVAAQQMNIEPDKIEAAAKQSLVSGMGAFSWIWHELSLAERVYLSAVALAVGKHKRQIVSDHEIQNTLEEYRIQLIGAELPNAAKDLVSREFLANPGKFQYRFTVELIGRWIEKEHPLDSTKQDIENINPMARAKFEEARRAYADGKLDHAIEYYQNVVRINPNHARGQIGLAQTLFEKGDLERAAAEFERAYFLDEANAKPGLIKALLDYGYYLEQQNDTKKALEIYKRILEYAPGNDQAAIRIKQLKPSGFVQNVLAFLGFGKAPAGS